MNKGRDERTDAEREAARKMADKQARDEAEAAETKKIEEFWRERRSRQRERD